MILRDDNIKFRIKSKAVRIFFEIFFHLNSAVELHTIDARLRLLSTKNNDLTYLSALAISESFP